MFFSRFARCLGGSLLAPLIVVAVLGASLTITRDAAAHEQEPLCDTGDTEQFSSVREYDYGADYIWCAKALGLTSGDDAGAFRPHGSLTRAQMAVFLVRLWRDVLHRDCPTDQSDRPYPFKDVTEDHWAYDEIACLYALEVTSGTKPASYSPNAPLTVAALTRFIVRMLNNVDHAACYIPEDHELDSAAARLAELNIAPDIAEAVSSARVTRSQMAVYLVGMWHYLDGKGLPPQPPKRPDLDKSQDSYPDTLQGQQPSGHASAVTSTVGDIAQHPMTFDEAMAVARILAPHIRLPVHCDLAPFSIPLYMPNATRAHRAGIHQGVDFACPRGRQVSAALDGQVVVAATDYHSPTIAQRNSLLATAKAIGATPLYTLIMLFGRHVVIDHGIVPGAGHVVSIYTHLEAIDPAARPGETVEAGQQIGRVGNSGTSGAAAGRKNSYLHLHWEIHINGQYLGAGLSVQDTRSVYETLFAQSI